tara:strand:+ start:894 stop:1790 length:897 start_codon:yes stop_codon:yes gene_type:complete
MNILWMTSLRPIGKSKENDKIQELFIKSLENYKKKITLSLTQFDDEGVRQYIDKKNIKKFYINFPRNKLPLGTKYSNKIMLNNSLDQYLNNNFEYLVYSTADILLPDNLFDEVDSIKKKLGENKEFCSLVYPNILKKNGSIESMTTPHYGIDIFIFRLKKNSILKFQNAIKSWDQYDWGINDNFYTSVCELLNLPIYNMYKNIKIIKFENDFKTINENRDWQVDSWKRNQKYYIKFLKNNNLSLLYAYGSYYYLLFKIFKLRDFDLNLFIVYFKFYLNTPKQLIYKFINFFNFKKNQN